MEAGPLGVGMGCQVRAPVGGTASPRRGSTPFNRPGPRRRCRACEAGAFPPPTTCPTMLIRTRLFGRHRDLVGRDSVEVELPQGATVGDLLDRLEADSTDLSRWVGGAAVAVNLEYADRGVHLGEGDEVALIPPVSGG